MSTLKTDAVTAVSTNGDLSLDGLGSGGVSIASTLKMTKGGDIASASPLVIDTDGNYFDVTGTTSFSAMTVESGNFFMLQFDGALTITHGSGIELPGAANLTTAAGDRLICYATAANTVEVMSVATEAAAAAGGAWTLVGTSVASSSASLTITGLNSTYDSYAIALQDLVPATNQVQMRLRFGDSSGVDSGGSDYSYHAMRTTSGSGNYNGAASAAYSSIWIDGGSGIGNDPGEGCGAMIFLNRPSDGTTFPTVSGTWSGWGITSGDDKLKGGIVLGARLSVITLDRINFSFSSGNVSTGRMTVWGIAHV